jgi:hypothetical protein
VDLVVVGVEAAEVVEVEQGRRVSYRETKLQSYIVTK